MDNNTKGFGIGLLVGVVLGLLFAPRPGKETRAMLKDKMDYVKDRAIDFIEVAGERSAEAMKMSAEAVQRSADAVKAKSAEAEGRIKEDRLARAVKTS
jgi:gas vesicle protein